MTKQEWRIEYRARRLVAGWKAEGIPVTLTGGDPLAIALRISRRVEGIPDVPRVHQPIRPPARPPASHLVPNPWRRSPCAA